MNKESNHLPGVIRQIPPSIESRLSTLSFNEKVFQKAVPAYQKTLKDSGYRHTHTLTYKRSKNDNNSTNINKIKRNRKR